MIVTRATVQQPTPIPSSGDGTGGGTTGIILRGVTVYLTGADGSVWDLTNGPVQLMSGVVGLLPQNVEHRWNVSPMIAGATRVGYGMGVQPLTLPVFTSASSALGWRDLDRSLWRALSPERACWVTVVSPDSETRVMRAWFTGAGDGVVVEDDPILMQHHRYDLEFVADDPYWLGATQSVRFTAATSSPYYAAAGSAFVKTLMPNNTLDSATVANNGDDDAWPLIAITGAASSATVTIAGQAVSYGALSAGQTVWLDYHPSRQTVGFTRGANDESAWLGVTSRAFRPVPAGAEVSIGINIAGPGVDTAVVVELTPRYRRPW